MEIFDTINTVITGERTALELLPALKQFKKMFEEKLKEVEIIALEEAENYEKTFDFKGNTFEKRAGRKIWNFKHIDEWVEADKHRKDIESKYKAVYTSYLSVGSIMADAETGEVLEMPIVTNTSDVLIVKKPKKVQ